VCHVPLYRAGFNISKQTNGGRQIFRTTKVIFFLVLVISVSEIGDALLSEMNITGFDITTTDLCSRTEEEDQTRRQAAIDIRRQTIAK
jgi:zona occludens toxin (predicted ATPase)